MTNGGAKTGTRPARAVTPASPGGGKAVKARRSDETQRGSRPEGEYLSGTLSATTLGELLEEVVIKGGSREAGDRLPSERELAERFGVGRPLVREALRTLVERKIIEVRVGRGSYVRQVTPSDVAYPVDNLLRRQGITARQLVEARSMLEAEAAALACQRATQGELNLMGALIEAGREVCTMVAKVRNDLRFHLSVVRAAHNPVVETMFAAIMRPTAEMMIRSNGDESVSREGLPFHEQIFLAIGDRDQARAIAASRGHLGVSERMYGADLDVELELLVRRGISRAPGVIGTQGVTVDDVLSAILHDL